MTDEFMKVFDGADPSGCIKLTQKEHEGWPCSYRSTEPETRTFRSWRKRWAKQRAQWSGIPLGSARVQKTFEEKLKAAKATAARRKKKPLVAEAVPAIAPAG